MGVTFQCLRCGATKVRAGKSPAPKYCSNRCRADHTFIDLAGKVFTDWSVVRYSHLSQHRQHYWWCRCKCGTERPVLGSWLTHGRSTGCGCEANKRLSER